MLVPPSKQARSPFTGTRAVLGLLGILLLAGAAYAAVSVDSIALNKATFMTLGLMVSAVGFLFSALFLNRDWRMMILIVTIVVIVSLFLVDIFLFWYGHHNFGRMVSAGFDLSFDARSREAVVRTLRERGDTGATPMIVPMAIVDSESHLLINQRPISPLAGVSGQTTVTCNEAGKWLTYMSDERGFRNPKGLWDGPVEIALLGDSFGHGLCLPDENGIAGRIRAVFPRTLNLSYSGNDPLVELATLREYLTNRKPRIVLWLFYEGNDFRDLARLLEKSDIFPRYLENPQFRQNLEDIQPDVDRALIEHARRAEARILADHAYSPVDILLLRNLRHMFGLRFRLSPDISPINKDVLPVFEKIMAAAKAEVSAWGGQLIFVYLPQPARILSKGESRSDPFFEYREFVLDTIHREGIPLIDLVPIFKAQPRPLSLWEVEYYPGNHYSERGYGLVVDQILRWLTNSHPKTVSSGN